MCNKQGDFDIGYYHMMSSMAQLRQRHVNESYSRSGKPSMKIIKSAEGGNCCIKMQVALRQIIPMSGFIGFFKSRSTTGKMQMEIKKRNLVHSK